MKLKKIAVALLLAGLALAGACGVTQSDTEEQSGKVSEQSEKPTATKAALEAKSDDKADGKTLTEKNCVRCHASDKWKGVQKSRQDWSSTIDQMSRLGASQWINNDQAVKIVNYLSDQNGEATDKESDVPPVTEVAAEAQGEKPKHAETKSPQAQPAQPAQPTQVAQAQNEQANVAAGSTAEPSQQAAAQAASPTTPPQQMAQSTGVPTTPSQQAYTGAEVWLYVLGGGGMIVTGVKIRPKNRRR
ncbi:MAG: hypothetical protein ACYC1U_10235 [Candidatus Aquicultorales bacterium]